MMENFLISHSLTKLWVHAIWGAKDRMPLLKENPLYFTEKDEKIWDRTKAIKLLDNKDFFYYIIVKMKFKINKNRSS